MSSSFPEEWSAYLLSYLSKGTTTKTRTVRIHRILQGLFILGYNEKPRIGTAASATEDSKEGLDSSHCCSETPPEKKFVANYRTKAKIIVR